MEPVAALFEATWNASEHEKVKAFVAESERPSRWATFDRITRKYKWQETLPRASDRRLERHNDSQWLSFHELEGYGEIRIWWEWEHPKWVIVRWQFKKIAD